MIKISYLFLFSVCLVFSSFGQSTIKGKVIDSDSGIPITNVSITNVSDKSEFTSNTYGIFELLKAGTYLFEKEGYSKRILNLANNKYHVIQLSISPSNLSEVIVNTNQLPKTLKKASSTISIISNQDITRGNDINIASVLNRAPGIFMQSGALNTNRITIRGIGSRNLFGTAKIKAYYKDIPLTTGTGETNIEDFELGAMARIHILKGASTIYGSGLGGTINIVPQSTYLNQSSIKSQFSVGSFRLAKEMVNINHGTSKNGFRAVYSHTHSDGYRENNDYNKQTITINSNHHFNKKNDLLFLASYIDLKAFIPSSIDETSYNNTPQSAAYTWEQSKGYEDTQRGLFGTTWNHQSNKNLKLITSIFTTYKKAYEPRPFNILTENSFALGSRFRLIGNNKLFKNTLNWTLGSEFFRDTHKSGTFENLYKDFPEGTGSVQGNRLSDFKEKRQYYNIFVETNYELSNKTNLSAGINYNKTSYDLNDRFKASETNPDQSGTFKFKDMWSPKFGVIHQLSKHISIYANINHGFSPISLNEALLPNGQINTQLKPETGWNFELGSRGQLLNNRLFYNLAIYRLDVKNLLVAKRTSEDEYIGVNAGRTQHDGLELNLNYKLLVSKTLLLQTFLNYTYNDFNFKQFIDDTNDYSGNKLTGVPSNILNLGMDTKVNTNFYGTINFQHVGSMPITDSNSIFTKKYNLTHLKFSYNKAINKSLKLNTFFGINNLFNTKYASQILINAQGFNGNAPRYYYPGNPRNYYTGIEINYIF
ncbi:TonB-dependent receptor [Snuella sp. CAU 1569]|uniref:TonB-dependent receptor n=1 Tax=Snuella sedimenti TaxID=2798802 RepID=A0A8J7J151_9FLAO|nr:TonB-dependent receptor [Snuella sedimenti]